MEAMDITLNLLYSNADLYHSFVRLQLRKLLELALKDTYFKLNGSIYKQLNSLAMGPALSPVIANIFINYFETNYLSEGPSGYQPFYYRRYLHDTLILFSHFNQGNGFLIYINSRHHEIYFTFEGKSENKLSFLNLTVEKANNEYSKILKKRLSQGLVSTILVIY